MKDDKKERLDFLFSEGCWTKFLNELPLKQPMTFTFKTAGQIMTLRARAAQLSKKPESIRTYSIKGVNYNTLTALIEAMPK